MLQNPKRAPLSALSIREMQPADAGAVSELAKRVWRAHYAPHIVSAAQIEFMLPRVASPESFSRCLSTQRVWLIYCDDALAGYMAVAPQPSNVWFIDKLYVDQYIQRGGLGSALLEHAARTLKPSALTLRVNRKNYQAINFYFKHGFCIEALDVKDIGGGYVMDDFLMRKTL